MFGDEGGGEAWPSCKVVRLDGPKEGGGCGTKAASMVKFGQGG